MVISPLMAAGTLAALATLTTQAPEARRAPETIVAPPPAIEPVEARVTRGGRVDIEVRAVPRGESSARVLVRSRPRHGALTGAVTLNATTTRFTYVHDGGPAASDEFLVAAQSPSSPVSASVRVTIAIVEPAPDFRVPKEVTLPVRFDLNEQETEVKLHNDGGGVIEGEATVDPPWALPDGGRFRLTAGGSQTLRLVFRPDGFRQYAGTLRYSGQEGVATRLQATINRPLTISPARLDLARSGKDSKKPIKLINKSPESVEAVLVAPRWLDAPGTVHVPALGSAEVEVSARLEGVEAIEGLLVVATGGFEQSITVAVPAAPPAIAAKWKGHEFPATPVGGFSEGEIELHNSGGLAARVELETPRGVSVAGGITSVFLKPGETRPVRLTYHPPTPGTLEAAIRLRWDSGETSLDTRLEAFVGPESLPTAPSADTGTASGDFTVLPAASRSAAPSRQSESGWARYTAPDRFAERRDTSLAKPAAEVRVVERHRHEAVIEWKRSPTAPEDIFIEIRWLRMGASGLPEFYWLEYTDAQHLDAPEGIERIRLRNLYAGTSYAFRISSLGKDGRLSPPVEVPPFATAPGKSLRLSPLLVLSVLAATLTALAAWKRWRAKQSAARASAPIRKKTQTSSQVAADGL